jgi:dTDP-4-amino-4,6-dideoxygalactose transaminase
VDLGWNYRITDLQAALGRSQLGKLDESINARKRIAKRYDEALSAPPFSERTHRPALTDGHSWHLYVIRFKEEGLRDQAYKFLKGLGIITQIHYTPLYRHPYFAKLVGNLRLPGAEEYFAGCLSIPLFPTLTQIDQDKVISELARFLSKH